MAPIPVIIGTTLAIVGTGYAFKKFVYDPHLGPLIEALIEEQKQQWQARQRQRVCVSVYSDSEGVSTSTYKSSHGPVLRRRRPAEVYELDENEARAELREDKMTVDQVERAPLIALEEKGNKSITPVALRSPTPSPARSPLSTSPVASSPRLMSPGLVEVEYAPDVLSETETGYSLSSSFVDAETYTPRSGTPVSPHPLSPALGGASLVASDFAFPSPNMSQAPSRPSSASLSISSWADDEPWRSGSELGSEWDAMSDTVASR